MKTELENCVNLSSQLDINFWGKFYQHFQTFFYNTSSTSKSYYITVFIL